MRFQRSQLHVILSFLLHMTCASTTHNQQLRLPNTNATLTRIRREQVSATKSAFQSDEVGWAIINEQVEMVTPLVLAHLQQLGIEHLRLPDLKEVISLGALFGTYGVGLHLKNGLVYNVDGVKRYGDAYMTYVNKSFLTQFYLNVNSLQFEYDFVLQLMPLEGYGKVIGSMEDTLIYAELEIKVNNPALAVREFRVVQFRNIHVQLDQRRIIRQVSGLILSPITNLFRELITTSISDGLKEQMQILIADFNNADPLQLRKFTKQVLSGLTGQKDK